MNDSVQQDVSQIDDFLQKLNNLDFGPLAYKLMNPEDRPGLSLEQALDAIKKYKGFLFLYYLNPGKPVSPSRYIDFVWHSHLLDTELYMVQTGILFGHYLHHFPFFGKRGAADETDLLAAAEFTQRQASYYFGWDVDDWCGTGRRPPLPGLRSSMAELARVIFPAGIDGAADNANPDVVTILGGHYRHTIEHVGAGAARGYTPWPEQQFDWGPLLRLPPWVIVCMPAELSMLNQIVVIRDIPALTPLSRRLVEQRLTPQGYSDALVKLTVPAQILRG